MLIIPHYTQVPNFITDEMMAKIPHNDFKIAMPIKTANLYRFLLNPEGKEGTEANILRAQRPSNTRNKEKESSKESESAK